MTNILGLGLGCLPLNQSGTTGTSKRPKTLLDNGKEPFIIMALY